MSQLNRCIVSIFCLALLPSAFQVFGQSAAPASGAPTASPDAIVITIGDLKITAREVEKLLESLPPQNRRFYSSPQGRQQFAEFIVRNKLLSAEAEKRRLQERDDVKLSLNTFRESFLANVMQNELLKETAVSDSESGKFLKDNVASFEQAKVRRIVIRSASTNQFYADGKPSDQLPTDEQAKAKAEEIRKKILEGADFEEMAAKFSDDPMTSGKGGDFGTVRRVNQDPRILITPPMLDAIFALKPGEVTQVLQTPFGFELLKVDERKVPKLDEVRQEIDGRIRQQKYEALYQDLRTRNAVKTDEAYFGAASPTAPVPPKPNL